MKKLAFLISIIVLSSGFMFAQTGGMKGKVRSSSGESISGATITVRQEGDDLKSAKSDSKGNFLLEGLKPGKYNVIFKKKGYGSGLMYNVEIVEKNVRDLGDRLILTVDDGSLVLINGSVYNQNGFAIYGAKVKIEKILGDGSTKKVNSGYTSRNGEFTFRYPNEAAKFRVTVSAKGVSASKDVEVEEAAIYRVALILELK
jgi:hypothetical protein